MAATSSASDTKSLMEIKRFDGQGFDLWQERMQGILFLKDCESALEEHKPQDMTDLEWARLNKKAMAYIKMAINDDILTDIKRLDSAYAIWQKLKSTYENTTPVNQVHLMRKLVNMQLDDSKSASEHLSAFTSVLSQLQDSGLQSFDDKLKAILLLMTLPDTWETLVVSLSNSSSLTYDGVRGSILNEEIRRKSSGESGSSAYNARGRSQKRDAGNRTQNRSKSKTKDKDVTCYQCGRKGHKKPDCRYFKKEQERKKEAQDKKKKDEKKGEKSAGDSSKDAENANVSSSVVIEELSDLEEILVAASCPSDLVVANAEDMLISQKDVIDALLSANDGLSQSWIVDSGASFHVTPSLECFATYVAGNYGKVYLGDNFACNIEGMGTMRLALNNGQELLLNDVRFVPGIKKSLLSVGQLDAHGYTTIFVGGSWKLLKGSMLVTKGSKRGTLYYLRCKALPGKFLAVAEIASHTELWHKRLGHMSQKGIEVLSSLKRLDVKGKNLDFCNDCLYGKQKKSSYYSGVSRKANPLDLVHSDVCTMPVKSFGGALYFVTFIDDCTRKGWVYLLKSKSETFNAFKKFHAFVTTQKSTKLKCLRSDNGGEYVSAEFQRFCDENGIKRELTAPYNPSSNGVAERYNRTLCERVRCMLSTANLSQEFWGEALKTAVHICNRSPNSTLKNDIPEEVWSGKPASYDHLRVFGCEAFVHVRNDLRTKLDMKSIKGIFLGYGEEGEMGYRVWLPQFRKVIRSRDVVFNEAKLLKNATESDANKKTVRFQPLVPPIDVEKEPHDALPQAEIDNQPVNLEPEEVGHDFDAPNEDGQPPGLAENDFQQHDGAENVLPPDVEPLPENVDHWVRRSTRMRRQPQRFNPSLDHVMLTDEGEPLTYKEAKSCKSSSKWELAMQEEMKSLYANDTWDLVPLPKGKKALPNKWVYKIKIVDEKPKYKARLVAKGYAQREGIDFQEVFSPVVKMTTLRVLFALAALFDLELYQMDVKTAFLHGDIDVEIYMKQPEGFVVPGKEKLVCKLKRSLYGLKQGPRQWYKKFDTFMLSLGFKRSHADHCLYTKKDEDGSPIILVLYVDDMLLAGKNKTSLDALKQKLNSVFAMKDLGDAEHILGMRIKRDRKLKLLFLSQEKYIAKVLDRFNMADAKPLGVPLPPHTKLSKADCPQDELALEAMKGIPYASACGSLMYAMVATRPDIAYAVGVVSRYMSNPGKAHWEAVKCILRYLKGTQSMCICYGKSDFKLQGYCDADMAGDVDTRKSTSGYVFAIAGGAVSWCSRLQKIVALSTTEAEYISATEASKEAIWLGRLAKELGMPASTPVLGCDSQSAVYLAKNAMFHARTKHIDVRYHFIRQVLEDGLVTLTKINTQNNPADVLTKSLAKAQHAHCIQLVGLS